MMTRNLGNCCPPSVLLTLAVGLLSGCANYQSADTPQADKEHSPALSAAAPIAQTTAPMPASPTAEVSAAAVSPSPASPPAGTVTKIPAATTVQPAAVTATPPSASSGFTDKNDTTSYLATPEYQEAIEYQAAIEKYLMDPFILANYKGAEKLIENSQFDVKDYNKLVIVPFVQLDPPEQDTALGKMITKQIASRFTQLGYRVAETNLPVSSNPQKIQGSYLPPQDSWNLASRYNARAVIVGHYAISQDRIFVNARLIDTAINNRIVSAYDYALPLNKTTLALITSCMKQGQWICRIP